MSTAESDFGSQFSDSGSIQIPEHVQEESLVQLKNQNKELKSCNQTLTQEADTSRKEPGEEVR